MKKARTVVALGVLGLLGVLVNYIFLYIAVAALCPLMHFLSGHGGHHSSSGETKNTIWSA